MTLTAGRERPATNLSYLRSPLAALLVVLAGLAFLLTLPLNVPIGPMYWDLFIYFDAANRIFSGQVPIADFFTPVGPLGYYLFAGGVKIFPVAQPLLLVHWSTLAVTAPLLALVLWQVDKQSRLTAFALLIPFLIFAILPFNSREYYPYPGSDGFGIYNRQVCQILYVLVAGLLFVRNQRILAIVVIVAMAALFFGKITGFLSGFLICAFAFLAGRMAFKYAAASALAFFALLAGLELWDGLVSQYIRDILALVAMNSESLGPRFLQSASHTFGVVAPAGLLILVLLYFDRQQFAERIRGLARNPGLTPLSALADHHAFWLATVLVAGIFFETQNTGSQAMIFVWPVLLSLLLSVSAKLGNPRLLAAFIMLAAAAALPPAVNMIERAARTYVGAVKNVDLGHDNLKTLGRVSARPEIYARAEKMIGFYADHEATYADFVKIGELPSYMFYSEYDFQLVHLMAIDRAITDLKALEAEKGIHFETIMTLNFVNPFPWLMDRAAPRYIAIGADPTRAVPSPESEEENAVRNTDVVLYPTCPLTTANADLYKLYAPALVDHRRITLDRCYDAYVHPRLAGKIDAQ